MRRSAQGADLSRHHASLVRRPNPTTLFPFVCSVRSPGGWSLHRLAGSNSRRCHGRCLQASFHPPLPRRSSVTAFLLAALNVAGLLFQFVRQLENVALDLQVGTNRAIARYFSTFSRSSLTVRLVCIAFPSAESIRRRVQIVLFQALQLSLTLSV